MGLYGEKDLNTKVIFKQLVFWVLIFIGGALIGVVVLCAALEQYSEHKRNRRETFVTLFDAKKKMDAWLATNVCKPHPDLGKVDEWKVPIRQKIIECCPDGEARYEVRSAGPDGQFDNDDDLVIQTSTSVKHNDLVDRCQGAMHKQK